MANESKQQLEEQRTDWAMERTVLAKQRTFSAWVRTGLTTMAVGFAVIRLLSEMKPLWMIDTAGAVFILTGGFIIILGFWRYRDTFRKLQQEGVPSIPIWLIGLITAALLIGGGLVLALIFLQPLPA